ncbi:NAD(P)-dependent oxidoreductase [Actinocorallia populi]|uniref:NAD(P)-dependent oxidoreductase n=1 Tax=Actinocorallia populi TaxID=2079200 RepID=UPI000D08C179|nr:NAD(P)-dependent oxidoreductase [Actinocorallia populi]
MRLGFVGAGRMGRPMVDRLTAAGHDVKVLARSAGTRRALEGRGPRVADDLAEVAADAEAVMVCVFTDEQVREVCLGGALFDAMPSGSVLVVHTTGSPATAEAVAAEAAARGIEALDVPVSGGPHDIAAGRLTLFAGGPAGAVERVRPALEAYGEPLLHVGPPGSGQRVKLLNNALFAAQLGLLADTVALAARWGLAEEDLLRALPHGSSTSRAMAGVASRGSVARFTADTAEFLGKDVDHVKKTSAELGGDLGALEAALASLAAALRPAPEETDGLADKE